MTDPLLAADLFCGAGGTSTGLYKAMHRTGREVDLTAINHWSTAIETHKANHPGARHLNARVEKVKPRQVVPEGRLDILVASPECTHFSVARGGRPISDQKRTSPLFILRWLREIQADTVLIENVPEFQTWGPLGPTQRPIPERKGETYRKFLRSIDRRGYTVEARVLNAADYGDVTTRRRLFIMARKGNGALHWPVPTHSKGGLVPGTRPWRAAREIIDWSIASRSIFEGKPLSPNTVRRIVYGLERFCGSELKPFLVVLRGTSESHIKSSAKTVDGPVPTISAGGYHVGVIEPFLLSGPSGGAPRSARTDPLATLTGGGVTTLIQAFLVTYHGQSMAHSIDGPTPTFGTRDRLAVVLPVIDGKRLDIRFRMLHERELALSMGFDEDYAFAGTRTEIKRQIGNAVAVNQAAALCGSLIAA